MAASIGGLRLAELLSDLESKAHNKACDEEDLKQGELGLIELIKAVENSFDVSGAKGANTTSTDETDASIADTSDSPSITSEQHRHIWNSGANGINASHKLRMTGSKAFPGLSSTPPMVRFI